MNKLVEIGMLRGWAILAVVSLHVVSNYREMPSPAPLGQWLAAFCIVARVGVPLFLFVSGRLFATRYVWPFSIKNFYSKRLKVLLIPYLFFSLLYLGLYPLQGKGLGWQDGFFRLLTASAVEPFWFFMLISELCLIYPLLAWWRSRRPQKNFGLWSWYVVWLIQLAAVLRLPFVPESAEGWVGGLAMFAEFGIYFFSGITSAPGSGSVWDQFWNGTKNKAWVGAIGLLVGFLGAAHIYLLFDHTRLGDWWDLASHSRRFATAVVEPFLFLMMIRLIMAINQYVLSIQKTTSTIFSQLGQDSYGIYLVHILFLSLAVRAAQSWGLTPSYLSYYVLVLAGTLVASSIAVRSIRFFLKIRPIIGE